MISLPFCLLILLILLIFTINISHILYLVLRKTNERARFFRSILLNFSFSSMAVAIWLIPFFYFRIVWSPESFACRLWSFLFHVVDAVQLYSLLLLITNTNFIHPSLQRVLLVLTWLAPILTYSPLLWLSSPYGKLDYWPYRRLASNVPWWILPTLYSCMYLVPLFSSFVLIGMAICWPWVCNRCKKRKSTTQAQTNEHRETMAELTSLVETVLSFELDQSTTSTINTWVPSVSSLSNPSSTKDQSSLSYISNKFTPSLSYRASPDHSSLLSDDLSSSLQLNSYLRKQHTQIHYCLLFLITSLLLLVHFPYVLFSLMDMHTSQLPRFIYLHWIGTMFIPIVHLQNRY